MMCNISYRDHKRQGKGTLTTINGDCYECYWLDDKMNGHGKILYANGDTYSGDFRDDRKDGLGSHFDAAARQIYIGQWSNNMRMGHGFLIYKDQSKYLEGNFKNDKPDGPCQVRNEEPNLAKFMQKFDS